MEKDINAHLQKMPTLKAGVFDNWLGKSKADELIQFYKYFSESFCAVIKGYEGLIKCYLALPSSNAKSETVIHELKSFMDNLNYQDIIDLCRHLPRYSFPEDIWKKLQIPIQRNEYFDQLKMITSPKIQEYSVMIRGKQLKELCNDL